MTLTAAPITSAGRGSPLGPLGAGGLLDQRPYKTQEGLMLRTVPTVREEIPDFHA